MTKSRFSNSQILGILKKAEGGVPIADLCREHGINVSDPRTPSAKSGTDMFY